MPVARVIVPKRPDKFEHCWVMRTCIDRSNRRWCRWFVPCNQGAIVLAPTASRFSTCSTVVEALRSWKTRLKTTWRWGGNNLNMLWKQTADTRFMKNTRENNSRFRPFYVELYNTGAWKMYVKSWRSKCLITENTVIFKVFLLMQGWVICQLIDFEHISTDKRTDTVR